MENFLLKCSMVDPLMASLPFYQNQFEQNHCKLSILLVRMGSIDAVNQGNWSLSIQ